MISCVYCVVSQCQWLRCVGFQLYVITFRVRRRRGEMCIGHGCLCVCLSLAAFPHYCTDPDVSWGNGRGCPLVVHYWVDLQLVHGFRCYDNIAPNTKSQQVLVLAVCLVALVNDVVHTGTITMHRMILSVVVVAAWANRCYALVYYIPEQLVPWAIRFTARILWPVENFCCCTISHKIFKTVHQSEISTEWQAMNDVVARKCS